MQFNPCKCPECGECASGMFETVPGWALIDFDENGEAELFGDNYWFALATTTCFGRTSLLPLGRRQPPWGLRKLPSFPRQPELRGLRQLSASDGLVGASSLRRLASSSR
jgi:hypothetical protein